VNDHREQTQGQAPPVRPGAPLSWAAVLPLDARGLILSAAVALAYWAVSAVTLWFLVAPGVGPVAWPAAGVALAALAVGGPRLWPGVVLGQFLAVAALGVAPGPADLAPAIGAGLAAALPAAALRRLRLDADLSTLHGVLWLAAAGIVGATVATATGTLGSLVHGVATGAVAWSWWCGHLAAVMVVTPAILSWRRREGLELRPLSVMHLVLSVGLCALIAYAIFLWEARQVARSWFIFPALAWPALVFSVRGASLSLLALAGIACEAAILGSGPFSNAPDALGVVIFTQQFLAVVSATLLILAAVADERRGQSALRESERRLRDETEALEVLNRTGAAIAAELDLDKAVQLVTDAGVSLCGAQFGAFFYNVVEEGVGDAGESYMLFALSGAPREAFERFGQPRNTEVFAPTFGGEGPVRVPDITKDPRYGHNPPHAGMPRGHLPVRSYLAAPVRSRSGDVIGGLFFGHPTAGVFTERAERLIVGLAAQAAIAIDNARLYQAAQREIEERRRAEQHQRLLMNELNHRVKNTLATVQSMGAQTLKTGRSVAEAREAFVSRLMALSAAHNLLTAERWESADLEDVARMATAAFEEPAAPRFSIEGPGVRLKAPHALGLAMALNELGSNAAKYGALSGEGGRVAISWTVERGGHIRFVWEEAGGPAVQPPLRRGFGSRLIQEGLARELRGQVEMSWRPEGLRCELSFQLEAGERPVADFDSED
jgi:two-component sensor histidine kinase/integral membrane sensor domain MASE1